MESARPIPGKWKEDCTLSLIWPVDFLAPFIRPLIDALIIGEMGLAVLGNESDLPDTILLGKALLKIEDSWPVDFADEVRDNFDAGSEGEKAFVRPNRIVPPVDMVVAFRHGWPLVCVCGGGGRACVCVVSVAALALETQRG